MIGTSATRLTTRCVRMATRSRSKNALTNGNVFAMMVAQRPISLSAVRMHGDRDHDHDHDHDFVPIGKGGKKIAAVTHSAPDHAHDHAHDHDHDHDHAHDHAHDHDHDDDSDGDDDDLDDMVDTVAVGPSGTEYGGPQRGGQFKEPTRFGDWERKGRCSDF